MALESRRVERRAAWVILILTFAAYASEWIAGYHGRTSRGIRESTREDYARALGLTVEGEPLTDEQGRTRGALDFPSSAGCGWRRSSRAT